MTANAVLHAKKEAAGRDTAHAVFAEFCISFFVSSCIPLSFSRFAGLIP
jgi:hypothetical protein